MVWLHEIVNSRATTFVFLRLRRFDRLGSFLAIALSGKPCANRGQTDIQRRIGLGD